MDCTATERYGTKLSLQAKTMTTSSSGRPSSRDELASMVLESALRQGVVLRSGFMGPFSV